MVSAEVGVDHTEQEVSELAEDVEFAQLPQDESSRPSFLLAFARAVLALYRTPAPVAVAERPWEREGWLDSEGRCWLGFIGSITKAWQYKDFDPELLLSKFADIYPRMLPHWALPLPEDQPGPH